jgi:hypothetical protein
MAAGHTSSVSGDASTFRTTRVQTLKNLCVKPAADALLLYEELREVPAAIKAPIFAYLIRNVELTAEHLKVILGSEQKKLDLSPGLCTQPRGISLLPPSLENPSFVPCSLHFDSHDNHGASFCNR